jgi:molecular chaperone DnaK (HSP70)
MFIWIVALNVMRGFIHFWVSVLCACAFSWKVSLTVNISPHMYFTLLHIHTYSQAKQQAVKNPQNTFMNLLKLLGAKADDAAALKLCKGLTTASNENGDLLLQPIDVSTNEPEGDAQDPITLLSMLLKKLKEIAEENVGQGRVGPCSFTVPCDLTPLQCEGVSKAGTQAGFDVIQVIKEPVAICLAYQLDVSNNVLSKKDQMIKTLKKNEAAAAAAAPTNASQSSYVMIVDVGGNDTCATVVSIDNGMMRIIASETSGELCGKLMVEEVVKFAAMFFMKKVFIER